MMRITYMALGAAMIFAATGPGLATEDPAVTSSQATPAPDLRIEDCKARLPHAGGQTGTDTATQPDSLSETLDECNSVITAPNVGDSELTTKPPSTDGSMPVLRPGEIPKQQSSGN